MKIHVLLLCFLTCISFKVLAGPVDESTARKAGQRFFELKADVAALKNVRNLQLVYTEASSSVASPVARMAPEVYFYVFNADAAGFVIVSGDDQVIPVLGYSDGGTFDPANIPQNAKKWLEEYKKQIRYVKENNIAATTEIRQAWSVFTGGGSTGNPGKTTGVTPLLTTRWNQSPYVDAQCPGGSVTGCVATAMAQIMKYWSYPATGTGFHSYNHSVYGTLSANFGATTYQWSSMPNTVNSSNSAVATLMYHCGVSVDMNYSPSASGSYVISSQSPIRNCAEYAFKTYFNYKSTLRGLERGNYTQNQWINLLKTELDNSRPVLYAGFGSGGGHAFVFDGYDNNDYFHINWGWGGAYDGYFSVNALNPSGTGTGGGTGGFNSGHQMIIGIEPPSGGGGGQTTGITLQSSISPSASTIYYTQSFSISTSVRNNGTAAFQGDFTAAIFDNNNVLVDSVEVVRNRSVAAGSNLSLSFQTTGLLSMLPGSYNVAILYRPAGGNWTQVNGGIYSNPVNMDVVLYNDLELSRDMVLTPASWTKGQPASVNLNIVNTGSTFYGQYEVNLYNLDGTYAQTIGTVNETTGLPYGYEYSSPYLTFSTNSVTVNPGTYLLVAMYNPNNAGWTICGSSLYQNPIKVTVKAPALQPDMYETNNTVAQSYLLPVNFSGNTATGNTVGSNLHTTSDNDFYKIDLPAGFTYTIKARLHDALGSSNGNSYTVDALFSYSTNGGTTWSDTYDDVMPNDIVVNGGGTVYFHVAPFFAGETGTYLLDMKITRSATTGVDGITADKALNVYPNPAHDQVHIALNGYAGEVNKLSLVDIRGRQIQHVYPGASDRMVTLQLNGLAPGVYFIQAHTGSGVLTEKIIVGGK